MLRYFFALFFIIITYSGSAQATGWTVDSIHLPEELRYFDHQYSSLVIRRKELYLMPECRLLEKQEAKLYCMPLKQIDQYLADTTHTILYNKLPITGLDVLINKMLEQGQVCEGLEAMVIHKKDIYFTVETTTESPLCYLLKGRLKKGQVVMDTSRLLALRKPVKPNGDAIYNASYECMEWFNDRLYIFFEYNYFKGDNYVFTYNKNLDANSRDSVKIERMPFRISDITYTGNNHFTAINSFYKGGGKDTINRPDRDDDLNNQLVINAGNYHDYARLVDIQFNGQDFSWQSMFEMPVVFEGFNWEGIVRYKGGYLMINDKYSSTKPYYSKLIYVRPAKSLINQSW